MLAFHPGEAKDQFLMLLCREQAGWLATEKLFTKDLFTNFTQGKMCRGHNWHLLQNFQWAFSFCFPLTLSWGTTPVSPRWSRCVDECMCVRSRVSYVRIIKKSTLLPCATVCYISPCCAARVTRSADPGVNITRPPSPSRKKTMNLLKSLFLLLFQVYYSTIDPFLYSVSFVMNVNFKKRTLL